MHLLDVTLRDGTKSYTLLNTIMSKYATEPSTAIRNAKLKREAVHDFMNTEFPTKTFFLL